jgi:CRP/FNR family cyclic AMP-dependent transcriptional regulator
MPLHEGTGVVREYDDGDVVFREGDVGEHLFVVMGGGICIRKGAGPVVAVLAEFGPGEMFGEQALVDSRVHSPTATAVGETTLAVYDRETFLASLREDPEFSLRVIASLASRLRTTSDRLQQIATQHVLDRAEMALVQRAVLETEVG